MKSSKVKLAFDHGGVVARVTLAAPKANIIDAEMITGLQEACGEIESQTALRAIVLSAEGPHFSFGASIEEHLPGEIAAALQRLHSMLRRMVELPAPVVAVVQGQCLGGGLELVLGCDLILAEQGAMLGCPEIKLGVFAPAASALLPMRIPGGHATRLLLTGTSCTADEAASMGLVDRVAPRDELDATLSMWLQEDFLPRSAAGLRHAVMAARGNRKRALEQDLPRHEELYLERLMHHPDAVEGIRAFMEKRQPRWSEEAS